MAEGFQGAFTPTPDDRRNAIDGKVIPRGRAEDPRIAQAKAELLKRVIEKGRKDRH